jgi:hypothetical protein
MKELLLGVVETLRDPPSTAAPPTSESRVYRITPESRAVLDFFDKDIDISDVFVCSECFEIRGSWRSHGEVFRQRCRCEKATLSEPDEAWFAFDFNKLVELCYCCGAELVESGFKSSVWFCGECKQRVERLNERCGGGMIPMGRFDGADQDHAVVTWTRVIVQDIIRACGLSEADPVPLGMYLELLADRPVDKNCAFVRLSHSIGLRTSTNR